MEIDLIGEALTVDNMPVSGFQRGISIAPALGAAVMASTEDDAKLVYAVHAKASITVGNIHQTDNIKTHLMIDNLQRQPGHAGQSALASKRFGEILDRVAGGDRLDGCRRTNRGEVAPADAIGERPMTEARGNRTLISTIALGLRRCDPI